jgi:peptidoglycan hydrolase-like protein with peptidoglycan-binding domain
LTVTLPPNASGAKLIVGEGDDQLSYTLALRSLPPIMELKGVQKRLENLGYVIGAEDPAGPKTAAAVASFQKSKSMEATGEIDDQLRQALQNAHGV